jgi:hypothetical protein
MKLISLDKLYWLLLKIMDVYWQKLGVTSYIQRFKVNKQKKNFKFASPFIFKNLNYVFLLKVSPPLSLLFNFCFHSSLLCNFYFIIITVL